MQVILLEESKLGGLGKLANVKAGYARNFLIPRKKAQLATKANLEAFEAIRADLETKSQALRTEAEKRKDIIQGLECTIIANVGEEDKLFGSVTSHDIVESLAALGHKVARKDINMPEGPIHFVGEYDIDISIHLEIIATIKVIVKGE
jgi:large subunit ribosomal protein L9